MTHLKVASVLMLILALSMFMIGYNMAGMSISAPAVTGLGFLVIAWVFWTHNHDHTH